MKRFGTIGHDIALLLAEVSRWESLSGGFRSQGSPLTAKEIVLGLAVAATAVGLIWFLWQRYGDGRRTRVNSPRKLFADLCTAHGLDTPSRRLLGKVARWQRLAHPARLFLEPERFAEANLSSALCGEHARLAAIKARLFEPPTEDSNQA